MGPGLLRAMSHSVPLVLLAKAPVTPPIQPLSNICWISRERNGSCHKLSISQYPVPSGLLPHRSMSKNRDIARAAFLHSCGGCFFSLSFARNIRSRSCSVPSYVIFGAEIEEIQQPFLAIRLASDGNMMLVKMCNVLVGERIGEPDHGRPLFKLFNLHPRNINIYIFGRFS